MFKITGLGEYRQRNGQKAVVEKFWKGFGEWGGKDHTGSARFWNPDGTHGFKEKDFDLIAPWHEEKQTVNSKRINDIIDSLPVCADGKQKVRELVKEIKPDFEVQPEVKAGQVWSYRGQPRLVVATNYPGNEFNAVGLDGRLAETDGKRIPYIYDFLADNLETYYAKKQRGEV